MFIFEEYGAFKASGHLRHIGAMPEKSRLVMPGPWLETSSAHNPCTNKPCRDQMLGTVGQNKSFDLCLLRNKSPDQESND